MGQNIFKLKNTRRFMSIAQTLDVIISQVDQKATKHEKLYSRVRNRRRAGNKRRDWKICQKE